MQMSWPERDRQWHYEDASCTSFGYHDPRGGLLPARDSSRSGGCGRCDGPLSSRDYPRPSSWQPGCYGSAGAGVGGGTDGIDADERLSGGGGGEYGQVGFGAS